MLTLRAILCPIDFSDHSREALLWASAIAERRGAQLTVLTVVDPLVAKAAAAHIGPDIAASSNRELRDFVETTLSAGRRVKPRLEVQVGEASEAILQASRQNRSDLLVMGTHGLGGLRKLMLGSTTERVLRGTQTAVLAVPKGTAPRPDENQSPADHLKRILMATDFGEGSSAAVEWALELARDLTVPIVFAHVVKPVVVPAHYREFVMDFDEENVARARRQLEQFLALVTDPRSTRVVSVGQPDESIASLAVEHGAGLIVMGLTNKRDSRAGPGSIAYHVLRSAHVAVLVVPPTSTTAS